MRYWMFIHAFRQDDEERQIDFAITKSQLPNADKHRVGKQRQMQTRKPHGGYFHICVVKIPNIGDRSTQSEHVLV